MQWLCPEKPPSAQTPPPTLSPAETKQENSRRETAWHSTCPGKVTITEDTPGALIYPTPLGGREDIFTSIFWMRKLRLRAKEESSPRKREGDLPAWVSWSYLGSSLSLNSRQASRPWECSLTPPPSPPPKHRTPFPGMGSGYRARKELSQVTRTSRGHPPTQRNPGLKSPKHLESSSYDV